ncbi:hypothetical protein NXG27_04220 [Megasphaera paucivorans]|uniref:tRNA_anti-like n=1 Tax=Megasphaera paucivorans TaxID=349095 RepID=A0A1G9QSQ6_9FIRM|nr:hypothetical protein [Megasphaera paucivorans]SDM14026.1 hypothetical protein SAMN05660299_00268 [Megasphaera paucivorans]
MIILFTILFFLAIISLILGLMKPCLIIRWGTDEKKTRGKAALISTIAIIIFAIGAIFSTSSTQKLSSSDPMAKTAQEETVQWNKSDPDALKNGNIKLAIGEIKKHRALAPIAESQDATVVYKSPWNYYGKVISFTGRVAIAENNPPDNDLSKALGGEACEIVIESSKNVIIDALIAGNVNNTQVGQQITLYGYPVGRTDVKNKIGGSFTHLVVIGKLQ